MEKNKEWAKEIFKKIEIKLLRTADASFDKIPYTTVSGVHDDKSINQINFWTNGFWPSLMLLMFSATKNETFLKTARNACDKLDKALFDFAGLDHDVGFLWNISSGFDYRLTGDEKQKNRFLIAANHLMGRFNCRANYFRAWNGKDVEGWAIIDCMMNLPLLYRASETINDDRFKYAAIKHADKTMTYQVREDGGCYHIVEYDHNLGNFIKSHTGQGYAEDSSWTRGQAWGIYGFALSYRYTRDVKYLECAKRIAKHFIENLELFGDVPPCDFAQPKEPVIYDTTAGVCAACGLLEIAEYVDEVEKEYYIEVAKRIVLATEKDFCDWSENEDSILQCGTEAYTRGIHKPIIYGDYFFVEAIYRFCGYDTTCLW